MKNIIGNHSSSSIKLTEPIKKWLQKQLSIDDAYEFKSLNELIVKYNAMVPETEKPLTRILDPTYPAKLIKEIAYFDMRNTVIVENGSGPTN